MQVEKETVTLEIIRESLKQDIRNISKPEFKKWCGKRWRNLFLTEALKDSVAVEAATQKRLFANTKDRPTKQNVAIRFLRGDGPDEWDTEMPAATPQTIQQTNLLFCPGLLNGLLPVQAFKEAFPEVERTFGINIIQSDSHPVRTCKENGKDIVKAIRKGIGLDSNAVPIAPEDALPPEGDFLVLCYSKGMADMLELLVEKPELKDRIKCIVNWAGAPGGSYLANSLHQSLKNFEIPIKEEIGGLLKLVSPMIQIPAKWRRLSEYDVQGALLDLTTKQRAKFLDENLESIDALDIPIFNISGSTTASEVPYFQLQGLMELNQYDANNDMQVIQKHSKIKSPMATDLAMVHAHHWDISYSPFPKNLRLGSPNLEHPFPKTAGLTAVLLFLQELELIK
ncbi:MAG: hypothetical protein AAF518_13595 [Spirochaetota bacterium]